MATKTAKRRAAKKPRAKATAKARPGARRQPETLRLRNVTPSFTATDLHRSIAFYRDVLGFVIGEEWRENGELTAARTTRTAAKDSFFMMPSIGASGWGPAAGRNRPAHRPQRRHGSGR